MRSDRKRSCRDLEKDREEKDEKIKDLQLHKIQLEQDLIKMERRVNEMKRVEEASEDYRKIVHELIEAGILDENGEIIQRNEDP